MTLDWVGATTLHRPIMVVAFHGWFDAGEAATASISWMRELHGSYLVATIDPESFFDFQQQRPTVRTDERGERVIEWPENHCHGCRVHESNRDLLVVAGNEPQLRWRTFSRSLLEAARGVGAELVVTLGSAYSMVPHTRPFEVVGSSTNPDLSARLGLGRPSYEGPTGLIGTLHDTLDQASMPVISLRVSVPHYIQGGSNPKATQALLRRFELVTGVTANPAGLDREVDEWEQRVDLAVAGDPDVSQYVEQLEARIAEDETVLGSGSDLAAEVEAFLREQNQRRDEGDAVDG